LKQGDTFSHQFTVTEALYSGFIELFQDKNPLHTDEDFARAKGFSGRVMHGNILNGFLSYFVGELLPVKNVIIQTQSIKFAKPVYLHDTLAFTAAVEEVFESVNTLQFKFAFTNALGQKVARGELFIGII
jgi:3-hydroxybutyryl-CoA dehydratase